MNEAGPVHDETWTTRRLMAWIEPHLEANGVHNPALVARMLLSHVLGGSDIELYTDLDRPASPAERTNLRTLVARAAAHEPVQYLVGRADFFGRSYQVNASTLIPRAATESLVQAVLDWSRGRPGPTAPLRIADLGTGSGCIGITLARQIPGAKVIATDVLEGALELARGNAVDQGVEGRIEFRLGSGLDPVRDGPPLDVICANLPYIPDAMWPTLDLNVSSHEPETALRGGPDGLDVIRPVILEAGDCLCPGGLLALEIDPSQAGATVQLAGEGSLFETAVVTRDEFGDERIFQATAVVSSPESSPGPRS